MDPRGQDNRLPNGDVHRVAKKVRDNEHVYFIAAKRLAQDRFAHFVLVVHVAHFAHELTLVRVRVRVAVREIHGVVVIY